VLQGDPSVSFDHELMITSIGVVETPPAPGPCARTGTQMGAWTFGALMTAIANDNPGTHLIAMRWSSPGWVSGVSAERKPFPGFRAPGHAERAARLAALLHLTAMATLTSARLPSS